MALSLGKMSDAVGAALDLAINVLDRIDRVELGAMLPGKGHLREHVMLGLVRMAVSLGTFCRIGHAIACAASGVSWAKAAVL
jgi:hypothetical protein